MSREVAEQLWQEMSPAVWPFPDHVKDVRKPIERTAFFPGGLGLWLEADGACGEFPVGQIMVVGQDFNTESAYERALERGTEVDISVTWRKLRELLRESGISPNRCFFTNVYMGLRDEGSEIGPFPGGKDERFVKRCVEFFKKQLEVAKPKLIVTLGLAPLRFMATHLCRVRTPKTLAGCTEIYHPVSLAHGAVTVVALTHPSLYHANVGRRKYGQLGGAEAEKEMIADGLKAAFP